MKLSGTLPEVVTIDGPGRYVAMTLTKEDNLYQSGAPDLEVVRYPQQTHLGTAFYGPNQSQRPLCDINEIADYTVGRPTPVPHRRLPAALCLSVGTGTWVLEPGIYDVNVLADGAPITFTLHFRDGSGAVTVPMTNSYYSNEVGYSDSLGLPASAAGGSGDVANIDREVRGFTWYHQLALSPEVTNYCYYRTADGLNNPTGHHWLPGCPNLSSSPNVALGDPIGMALYPEQASYAVLWEYSHAARGPYSMGYAVTKAGVKGFGGLNIFVDSLFAPI